MPPLFWVVLFAGAFGFFLGVWCCAVVLRDQYDHDRLRRMREYDDRSAVEVRRNRLLR